MKKFLSGLLTLALLVGTIPVTNLLASEPTQEPAKFTGFDKDNIAYRFAVLSDVHITYDNYNESGITSSTRKYAAAVAQLAKISDGKLDTVMLAGDYTGTGRELPRESFAQVTDKLFTTGTYKDGSSVWADGNTPNLILAYGNHDTYQAPGGESFTTVAEHEATFNKYESLKTTVGEEGRLLSTDGEGSYLLKDGDYYFLTVQVEHYSKWDATLQRKSNTYSLNTLKWLKDTLEKIEAGEYGAYNDGYIYIATHAPVEDTVYGSDPTFCGAAAWGSTKLNEQVTEGENVYNFNSILSEHPQVILFSGHTHMAPILETTIMSKDYTNIVVGSVTDPLVYTNIESDITYLDSDKTGAGNGYGVYVEVDTSGNQKIHRLSFEDTSAVDINATCSTDENNASLYGITLNSWTSTLDNSFEAVEAGPAWTLPSPTVDGNYLNYYSKENRNQGVVPTFNSGDVVVENFVAGQNGATMKVKFPTATTTAVDTSVFNYKIEVCKEDGTALYTTYALGDWYPNASGGVAAGQRKNATSLTYQLADIAGITDADEAIYVEITAMDEYGNMSITLKSVEVTAENASTAPKFSKIGNPNLLATMAGAFSANETFSSTTVPTNAMTLKGINGEGGSLDTHVNFFLDRTKYNEMRQNNITPGTGLIVNGIGDRSQVPYMSDLNADESVVYEMDIKTNAILNSGSIQMRFRSSAPKSNPYALQLNLNKSNLAIAKRDLYGSWATTTIQTASGVKLEAGKTLRLVLLVTPTKASVWVDDTLVINECDMSSYDSETLTPVFSIQNMGADLEFTNMRVYRYDTDVRIGRTEPTKTIAQKSYTDAENLRIRTDVYNEYRDITGTQFYEKDSVGAIYMYPSWLQDSPAYLNMFLSMDGYDNMMKYAYESNPEWADYFPRNERPSTDLARYVSDFDANDTVVHSFTYTAHTKYFVDTATKGHKFEVRLRGTGTNAEGIALSIQSDGLYVVVGGKEKLVSNEVKFTDATEWKSITTVTSPNKISVWYQGNLIVDNLSYTSINANAPKTTYPVATYVLINAGATVQKTKVYNYDETVWDSVRADEEVSDNIVNKYFSNLKNHDVFGFDDVVNVKMATNYSTHPTWTTTLKPLGEKDFFDGTDSYVYSATITLTPDSPTETRSRKVCFGKDANDKEIYFTLEEYGIELKKQTDDPNAPLKLVTNYDSKVKCVTTNQKLGVIKIKAIVSATHITLEINGVLVADNISLQTTLTKMDPYFTLGGYNFSLSDVYVHYNNVHYEQAAETALEGKLAEQESYTNATWKAYQDAVNTLTEAAELTCDKTTRNKIKLAISEHSGTYSALKQAVPGDVNGDDSIDVRDIVRYKKYIKDSSTDIRPTGADIKVDTSYNKDDLDKLKDMLLGVTEE